MSFDIIIHKDEDYSDSTDLATLTAAIAAISGIKPIGPRQFEFDFNLPDVPYPAQIFLEYVSGEGDTLLGHVESDSQPVNMISVLVSHGLSVEIIYPALIRISHQMAKLRDWRVFDPQLDEYVEELSGAAALAQKSASSTSGILGRLGSLFGKR